MVVAVIPLLDVRFGGVGYFTPICNVRANRRDVATSSVLHINLPRTTAQAATITLHSERSSCKRLTLADTRAPGQSHFLQW